MKLKVGDRIRIVNDKDYCYTKIESQGVITEFIENNKVVVLFDIISGSPWHEQRYQVDICNIEKIEGGKVEKVKLKDKIVLVNDGGTELYCISLFANEELAKKFVMDNRGDPILCKLVPIKTIKVGIISKKYKE